MDLSVLGYRRVTCGSEWGLKGEKKIVKCCVYQDIIRVQHMKHKNGKASLAEIFFQKLFGERRGGRFWASGQDLARNRPSGQDLARNRGLARIWPGSGLGTWIWPGSGQEWPESELFGSESGLWAPVPKWLKNPKKLRFWRFQERPYRPLFNTS